MKRMLINMPTMGREGIVQIPWLIKFRRFQDLGWKTDICTGLFIENFNLRGKDVYNLNQANNYFGYLPFLGNTSRINLIAVSLYRNIYAIKHMRKIIKENYNIIYSPSSVLDLIILPFICKLITPKVKWATVLDNTVPLRSGVNIVSIDTFIHLLSWCFFRISIFLLKKADSIFVVNPLLRKYLLKNGFKKHNIILTGNAVEVGLIKSARIRNHAIDALYVGRINEAKGIYDMLHVLNLIKVEFPKFHLAIMGEGDPATKKVFKDRIKRMGLENNVLFLGYRSGQEKFDIIKSSKCFLFLSHAESFGVSLLEAVCSGLKVFAYNLPVYKLIYKHGEIYTFKNNDYSAIATAIIDTFKKNMYENEAGLRLSVRNSWDKIAELELRNI